MALPLYEWMRPYRSWPLCQACGSHRPQQGLAVAITLLQLGQSAFLAHEKRWSFIMEARGRTPPCSCCASTVTTSGNYRCRSLMHSCCNSRTPGSTLASMTFAAEAGYGCTLLCQTTNRYCNRAGRCRGRRAIAIAVAAAAASDMRPALQSGGGRPFVDSSRLPTSWTGGVRSPWAKGNTNIVCRHEPWERMGRTNDSRRKVAAT